MRETAVDYEETARLATAAFASESVSFEPGRLRWFYERCFREGATVIALRDDGRKIGQFAMVRQTVMADGVAESAAQLVDLFILADYRGRERLKLLYDAVAEQFAAQDIRFAIGMPNRKAAPINAHFFGLETLVALPIHMGVALPAPWRGTPRGVRFDVSQKATVLPMLAPFRTRTGDNGLPWREDTLFERLSGPKFEYGLHVGDDVLLVSSPRLHRGVPYTLLCCLLTRGAAPVDPAAVGAVVRSACRMWGRRLFVYIGLNRGLRAAPGVALPDRIRPTPMIVQLRDFKPDRPRLRLDRYELIDFDFA